MEKETTNIFFLTGLTDFHESMKRLHENWGWLLALGIALSLLAVVCLAAAGLTTLASVIFFGSLLAISGAMQVLHAFSFRLGHGLLLSLLAGLFYTVVGVMMLARPDIGAVSLTLLLSGFFIVGGILRCAWTATIRYPSWGWGFFSGLVTVALGIYIVASLPYSAVWMIGTVIGIEMLFNGWSWIMLSAASRAYEPPVSSSTSEAGTSYPRRAS